MESVRKRYLKCIFVLKLRKERIVRILNDVKLNSILFCKCMIVNARIVLPRFHYGSTMVGLCLDYGWIVVIRQ